MFVFVFVQFGMFLFGVGNGEYVMFYYFFCMVFKMGIGIGKIQFLKMNGSIEFEVFVFIFLIGCMLSMIIIFVNIFIVILDDVFYEVSGREYLGDELGVYLKSYLVNCVREKSILLFKRVFRKLVF